MSIAIVTGSAGLIGSETARHLAALGYQIVGFDNDLRSSFFGAQASTRPVLERLRAELGRSYEHHDTDIRDRAAVREVFQRYGRSIEVVVHCAAQPGHAAWSLGDPLVEFEINATATLGLLELTREYCSGAAFLFCSSTKVYGDRPNSLPVRELDTRWEIDPDHEYADGITENMPVDQTLHLSLGMSKLAADVMVQEYGRHHGLATACFRNCVVAGSAHSVSQSHGMLSYIMWCATRGVPYTAFGFKGKQVRDVMHVHDLTDAFERTIRAPHPGAVYNMGGGRFSNCSLIEAVRVAEEITGNGVELSFQDETRLGDHIWWIGSNSIFQEHHPDWRPQHDVKSIMQEIYDANQQAWRG